MIIKGTTIEIPESLVVPGDVHLWHSGATELPEGLTVGGDLDLRGTTITVLPEVLTVGGTLYLSGTKITVLPGIFTVVGRLFADDGQLIASEKVQLEWIAKCDDMLQVFKAPTANAKRLHQMLWKI